MLTMSYESSSGAQARNVEEPRGSMYRSCTSFTWGKVMIGVSMVPVQMLSIGIGGTYLSSVTIYILLYERYIWYHICIYINLSSYLDAHFLEHAVIAVVRSTITRVLPAIFGCNSHSPLSDSDSSCERSCGLRVACRSSSTASFSKTMCPHMA